MYRQLIYYIQARSPQLYTWSGNRPVPFLMSTSILSRIPLSYIPRQNMNDCRGGGSTARLGGRELTLLCGFNQYTLLQNRDNSGLLGTPLYCSLKLGEVGGGGRKGDLTGGVLGRETKA